MDTLKTGSEILQKIREGDDRKVAQALYKKVFPMVKRFVTNRYGSKDDAFDVFQDALVDFYKMVMAGTYKEEYDVYGYLYKLGSFKWLNKLKRNQKIEFKENLESYDLMEDIPEHEFLLLGQSDNILEALFAPIGKKCIELLTYTILHNMLLEDVMLRMEFSSVAAVKMQQQRCKQKIMDEIGKRPELLNKLKQP